MEPTETISTPEATLVQRAQAGDTLAFEALYRTHVERVYAICLRMVADEKRAVELTQDTFVRVWQRLDGFQGASAFSSWLYRVTVNTVLGALRTERRRQARIRPTNDLTRYDQSGPVRPSLAALDLEKAIAALPTRARQVLVLHALEGYRHDEIAAMLDIAPGTSKAHLHRARGLLKTMLRR